MNRPDWDQGCSDAKLLTCAGVWIGDRHMPDMQAYKDGGVFTGNPKADIRTSSSWGSSTWMILWGAKTRKADLRRR